jgi:hypothetical protein
LKEYLVRDFTNRFPDAAVERRFTYDNCWKWIINQYKTASVNSAIVRLLQTLSHAINNRNVYKNCNSYRRFLYDVTLISLQFFSCASVLHPLRFLLYHTIFLEKIKKNNVDIDLDTDVPPYPLIQYPRFTAGRKN